MISKPRQGRDGGFHRLEAARRPDYPFERAMIRFKDVIQIFRGAVYHIFRQQPFVLQAQDRPGIRRQLIRRDGGRWIVAHRLYGFTQETISGVGITAIGQHEGDQPTVLVDRAKQVLPLAPDADVGRCSSFLLRWLIPNLWKSG
jgi:hypothetical protein